jgi:3-hydroxybutyryl-CoA dehydrogenase
VTIAGSPVRRVGVVGCGQMGAGIAEVSARAGFDVVAIDRDAGAVERARVALDRSFDRAIRAKKLDEAEAGAARARITLVTDMDALGDRNLVVEAVVEQPDIKVALFQELDRIVVADDAILASNTSSIPIMKLAMATARPEQVLGIHFFNPVPVLPLIELVVSLVTDADVVEQARTFAEEGLDKRVIRSQDRAGFIVNALLIPYLLSAVRMFESGFASREDIDQGMVLGCAHPLGPLALADLIGLDTVAAVADSLYEEFKDPLYSPPPLLARMVDAGLLGRKASRGFHDYTPVGGAAAM